MKAADETEVQRARDLWAQFDLGETSALAVAGLVPLLIDRVEVLQSERDEARADAVESTQLFHRNRERLEAEVDRLRAEIARIHGQHGGPHL